MSKELLTTFRKVNHNMSVARLVESAILRSEGTLSQRGALSVDTGKYTGRSPNDRFIVDEPTVHDYVHWGKINRPFAEDKFQALRLKVETYLAAQDEVFVFDGHLGANEAHRINIRIVTELASHSLFAHQIFIRPKVHDPATFQPYFTVLSAPGLTAVPEVDGTNSEAFVIISFEQRLVIIGGTGYAGEIKKSMFSAMNYLLPQKGILPMHCSANRGTNGVALFFGLSGTGKTTLSADPNRELIGDDEHGWADDGIFNFEGGCYAKCINLCEKNEPQIYNALRFGALLENVVLGEEDRVPDFDDESLTENTRGCYPIEFIPNASATGVAETPRTIVFLTADAFGVMPPVAKLSKEQAMYHFMSGYTSKLAGTERGITEPQATFSSCFGAPFLPMHPSVYAKLLGEKIESNSVRVYMVNTGWTGGGFGTGRRISIAHTRAIVTAILDGSLELIPSTRDPIFKIDVPDYVPGVPQELLFPRNTWTDKQAFTTTAVSLAQQFITNFAQFAPVESELTRVGPSES
ncbi:MAG TPA: phosphoenolpyruvate carboxykinase (ATP) [Bacillota bacterium]|nr:phosphoenolpyruvate carboxykinase (ATP) [Bacillota bacterium]